MDEVLRLLDYRFGSYPAISQALEWLQRLLAAFKLVPRSVYEVEEVDLASKVRGRKDIPVLVGAIAVGVDCLVSGYKNLLVLQTVEGMPIRRTCDILTVLERDR